MIMYGLTSKTMQEYRKHLANGVSFGYLMNQLSVTYRARKVMYDNRTVNS